MRLLQRTPRERRHGLHPSTTPTDPSTARWSQQHAFLFYPNCVLHLFFSLPLLNVASSLIPSRTCLQLSFTAGLTHLDPTESPPNLHSLFPFPPCVPSLTDALQSHSFNPALATICPGWQYRTESKKSSTLRALVAAISPGCIQDNRLVKSNEPSIEQRHSKHSSGFQNSLLINDRPSSHESALVDRLTKQSRTKTPASCRP